MQNIKTHLGTALEVRVVKLTVVQQNRGTTSLMSTTRRHVVEILIGDTTRVEQECGMNGAPLNCCSFNIFIHSKPEDR